MFIVRNKRRERESDVDLEPGLEQVRASQVKIWSSHMAVITSAVVTGAPARSW